MRKFIISVLLPVLLFSCATAPPHKSSYYTEVLSHKYPGSNFEYVDKMMVNIDKGDEETIASVISIINRVTNNQWEKTRAVYIWITHNISYDTKSFFGNSDGPTNAEDTFKARQSVCEGYSELFNRLGRGVGLDIVKVNGYAKDVDYCEGKDPGGSNHAWNAVFLDNKWHLFDSTWGAGTLNGKNFVREYEEFYFDSPPEYLIFSHYPENINYQLLSTPIDRKSFFRLPNLKSEFFKGPYDVEPLIKRAVSGEVITEPVLYKSKAEYYFIKIPITNVLNSKMKYRFVIKSNSAKMMIQNGSNSPEIIENTDGVFEIYKEFKKGSLVLYLSYPKNSNSYSGIIKYSVE